MGLHPLNPQSNVTTVVIPHGSAHVDAMVPVEGLHDKGHGGGAASSEQDSGNGDTSRVLPRGVNHRTLSTWRAEPAVIIVITA